MPGKMNNSPVTFWYVRVRSEKWVVYKVVAALVSNNLKIAKTQRSFTSAEFD